MCVSFVVMATNTVETISFAFGYFFPLIAKSWKQGIFPCSVPFLGESLHQSLITSGVICLFIGCNELP